jgi:hypothetical protein
MYDSYMLPLLIRDHLDAIPPDATDLSFGNSVYQIRFEDRKARPLFGHKYWFTLEDAVDNVPEYIVRWDNFVQWVPYQLIFFVHFYQHPGSL